MVGDLSLYCGMQAQKGFFKKYICRYFCTPTQIFLTFRGNCNLLSFKLTFLPSPPLLSFFSCSFFLQKANAYPIMFFYSWGVNSDPLSIKESAGSRYNLQVDSDINVAFSSVKRNIHWLFASGLLGTYISLYEKLVCVSRFFLGVGGNKSTMNERWIAQIYLFSLKAAALNILWTFHPNRCLQKVPSKCHSVWSS